MPIVLPDGSPLYVEKYLGDPNNRKKIDANYQYKPRREEGEVDHRQEEGEVEYRREEGEGDRRQKEYNDFPKTKRPFTEWTEDGSTGGPIGLPVGGSAGGSTGGSVTIGDKDIDRPGEGDILIPIDNWRHAVIHAMSILKKERRCFKNTFFEKGNIYPTTLACRGFEFDNIDYLTLGITNTNFLIDNINLLNTFNFDKVGKYDCAISTFCNLNDNYSSEICSEDNDLYDEIKIKASKELVINEFLRAFEPRKRKFTKNRYYQKDIEAAITDLRKLGYIKHPNAKIFKGISQSYCGFTERRMVERAVLVHDGHDYVIHADTYRLYHILYGMAVSRTGINNIFKIDISGCTGIDIEKVLQYDRFVLFNGTKKVYEVYEVIEVNDYEVRLLIKDKSDDYLKELDNIIVAKRISSTQTLSLRDSQSITYDKYLLGCIAK